jgi:hypothetical protein
MNVQKVGNLVSVGIVRPIQNARLSALIQPKLPSSDPRSAYTGDKNGTKGIYKIVLLLTIPGKETMNDVVDSTKLLASGESLLKSGGDVTVNVSSPSMQGPVLFRPNDRGQLANATLRVNADGFEDAEAKAYDIVYPMLSNWSFQFDIPLDVKGHKILEENSGYERWVFNLVGGGTDLIDGNVSSRPEHRRLFAIYREAMNSTNVFYRFLNFWKVIEGVKSLRDERRRQASTHGVVIRNPPDRFPGSYEDLADEDFYQVPRELVEPYLGKKFNWIVDQFRDVLRNAIAHLDPTGTVLNPDDIRDTKKCQDAIFIIKYVARSMLMDEVSV